MIKYRLLVLLFIAGVYTMPRYVLPAQLGQRDLRPPLLVDVTLLTLTALLVCFSIVMVYSTTGVVCEAKFGDSLYYVKRQGAAALIGFVVLWLLSRQRVETLRKISPYLYFIGLVFLTLLIIPGIGTVAGGARRWVVLGPVRFQPGEFTKLFFVLFVAGYFARHEKQLSSFMQGILMPFMFLAPLAALFLQQPDFGSCAILAMVVAAMSTAAGVRLRHLAFCAAGAVSLFAMLIITSPYRMSRVISFLSPMEDAQGKGYQLVQSLIAVASGHFTGVGLGGSQQKLFFLPAAHTDFLFAVIAEELGFIGALLVILCFLVFLVRGLVLAAKLTHDTFSFTLAVGLTLLIVGPALVNIGVVTGLLPTKGLVLPLLGYGGTSLVASLAAVGLLLALVRNFRERTL